MLFLKRILDILLSLLVIIFAFPIMILIAIGIILEDGYPIFFNQKRLGYQFQEFTMYKFRTMKNRSQMEKNYFINYKDDERLLRVGKLTRGLGLDELPQLINIFKGDMSIVGPRPQLMDELEQHLPVDNNYYDRFLMKPGVTGFAQLKGRSQLVFYKKTQHDLKYIDMFKRYGIVIDLIVIVITPLRILDFKTHYDKESS